MAAHSYEFQPGNEMWKHRSKHGREAIFATPDILLAAAIEYFQDSDAHPWYKYEAIKSGDNAGDLVMVPTARPYTVWAMCRFMGVNSVWFSQFRKSKEYTLNQDSWDEVLLFIAETIKTQKYEGASVGAFNSNLIMRDLGITDIPKPQEGDPQSLPPSQTIVYLPQKGSTEITPIEYDDV